MELHANSKNQKLQDLEKNKLSIESLNIKKSELEQNIEELKIQQEKEEKEKEKEKALIDQEKIKIIKQIKEDKINEKD